MSDEPCGAPRDYYQDVDGNLKISFVLKDAKMRHETLLDGNLMSFLLGMIKHILGRNLTIFFAEFFYKLTDD